METMKGMASTATSLASTATSYALSTIENARAGALPSIAAVASISTISLFALRSLLCSKTNKQKNGGTGGKVRFVDPSQRTIVITGCDSGFGFSAAVELARLGFTVFAGVLNQKASEPKLQTALAELAKNRNATNITGVTFNADTTAPIGRLVALQLDVTSDDSVADFQSAVLSQLSGKQLFALINNAGINDGYLIEMSTVKQLQRNMDVNYLGAFRVLKAFLPTLRKEAAEFKAGRRDVQPRIVNVTSGAGIMVSSPLGACEFSSRSLL